MFLDADYPADPYPGARPDLSFVHEDGQFTQLRHGRAVAGHSGARLRLERVPVEDHLAPQRTRASPGRSPCCACAAPGWPRCGRRRCGCGTVSGRRRSRRRRTGPETHAVWLATPEQVRVLDVCEGRGERYRLARLHTGEIRTEDGILLPDVLAYLGASEIRLPLLVDGKPVPCAEVPQADAIGLRRRRWPGRAGRHHDRRRPARRRLAGPGVRLRHAATDRQRLAHRGAVERRRAAQGRTDRHPLRHRARLARAAPDRHRHRARLPGHSCARPPRRSRCWTRTRTPTTGGCAPCSRTARCAGPTSGSRRSRA